MRDTKPMKDLKIEGKKDSLDITCTNGSINIVGNSILPNPVTFFKPVFDWIKEYVEKTLGVEVTHHSLTFYGHIK